MDYICKGAELRERFKILNLAILNNGFSEFNGIFVLSLFLEQVRVALISFK